MNMNRRRQLLSAIGLGSLVTGVTAAIPRKSFASTERASRTVQPVSSAQRPEYSEQRANYKVLSVPAGASIEDAFNSLAGEGFQYVGSAQRYGDTEYIFVKWTPDYSSS